MKKILSTMFIIVMLASPSWATKTFIKGTLTGGVSGCLDEIDGAELTDGDRALVLTSTGFYTYVLDADSAATEDGDNVISPDSNAGDKRWVIVFPNLNVEKGFYTDGTDGANVHRVRDKILIADAADYDGKGTPVSKSWLGALGDGANTCIWMEQNARLASITARGIGIFGGAGSTEAPGLGGGSLGVVGYAINDNADTTHNIWGGYFEGVREDGTGQAVGIEINVTNLGVSPNVTIPNPYNTWSTSGTSIALSIASGGDATVWPTSYDADVGIELHPNGSLFKTGLIFRNGALVRDSGASGPAHAILLAYDHQIEWYEYTTNTLAAYITSNITDSTSDTGMIFYDGGVKFVNGNDNILFVVQETQNAAVNYFYTTAAVTGTSPALAVAGTDTDIDFWVTPKGAGKVRFGSVTTDATATIAGYITIKDSAGNTRYIATVTPTP